MKLNKPIRNQTANNDHHYGGEIQWLDSINDNDICCGRGKSFNNRPGNLIFQKVIHQNIHRYENAVTRKEKSAIVSSIVSQLRNDGSRFVKSDQSNNGKWYDIGHAQAHEKTGHAIRDCILNRSKRMKLLQQPQLRLQQPRRSIQAIQRQRGRQHRSVASAQGGRDKTTSPSQIISDVHHDTSSIREEKVANALLLFSSKEKKKNGNEIICCDTHKKKKENGNAVVVASTRSTEYSSDAAAIPIIINDEEEIKMNVNNFNFSPRCNTILPVPQRYEVRSSSTEDVLVDFPSSVQLEQEYQDCHHPISSSSRTTKAVLRKENVMRTSSFLMSPPRLPKSSLSSLLSPLRVVSSSSNYYDSSREAKEEQEEDEFIIDLYDPIPLNSEFITARDDIDSSLATSMSSSSYSSSKEGGGEMLTSYNSMAPEPVDVLTSSMNSTMLYDKKKIELETPDAMSLCSLDMFDYKNPSYQQYHHQGSSSSSSQHDLSINNNNGSTLFNSSFTSSFGHHHHHHADHHQELLEFF